MKTEYYDFREALSDDRFTRGEKLALKWQHHMTGGFEDALWLCIQKADMSNLAKLRAGFPDYVEGFEAWKTGALQHKGSSLGYGRLY